MNKVILIGRLGRDPELRYTQGGTGVANFTVATNERWKDDAGEAKERTEWHKIVAWGAQAEFAAKYLAKGRQVLIEGRLQAREYEDKAGAKRSVVEIVAMRVEGLGPKPGDEPSPKVGGEGKGKATPPDQGFERGGGGTDEIPF